MVPCHLHWQAKNVWQRWGCCWTSSLRCFVHQLRLKTQELQLVWFMNVERKWSSPGKMLHSLLKSDQRNLSWAQRSSWWGSTEHQSAHIRHIYLLLWSRPSGWTGFIFYEQQLPAKIKWLLWPRLVSSTGGGHRPGVSPEMAPDWTSQIRESSSEEVKTGCKLKQHFQNNVKFKQLWPVNIIIIKKNKKCHPLNWTFAGLFQGTNDLGCCRHPGPRFQRESREIWPENVFIDKGIKHFHMLYTPYTPALCLRPMFVSVCC